MMLHSAPPINNKQVYKENVRECEIPSAGLHDYETKNANMTKTDEKGESWRVNLS